MLELVIAVLLVFMGVQEYFNRKERKSLLEMIMAKNLTELGDLEVKQGIKPSKEKPQEDFILESDLSDEKFSERVQELINK